MSDLILVGDEAWTPKEWEAEQARRQRPRSLTPEQRARQVEVTRRWREANPGYHRDWMRRWRADNTPHYVGSLHDLACTGPTKATGCRCTKIKCYDRPRKAA